jgi:hypothetical protein
LQTLANEMFDTNQLSYLWMVPESWF